jgi:hypothetical protein
MIGPALFRQREFVGISSKRDHLRTAPEKLGVLNSVRAKSADPERAEDPIRGERACVTEFFDTPVRSQTRISQRG